MEEKLRVLSEEVAILKTQVAILLQWVQSLINDSDENEDKPKFTSYLDGTPCL